MLAPRWRKIFQDLWLNKTRTLLTLLTIAVGVFAVGFVSGTGAILLPDMDADYQTSNPSGARLLTEPFEDEMVYAARKTPGVADAEGRSGVSGLLLLPPERKISLQIEGIPDPGEIRINRLKPVGATLPPLGKHQILIDHSAAGLGLRPGDRLRIELPKGLVRELTFAGFVHDVNTFPYGMSGEVSGYVTPETIEWLDGPKNFNQMLITVSQNRTSRAHVSAVAQEVADRLENSGVKVNYNLIFNPGRHFASDITQAIMVILSLLGWMSVVLSAFLVVNTVSALMSQQVRSIGVMKAIGGRTSQIMGMYLGMILCFGGMAFLVAAPLASLLSYQVGAAMSSFLNFQLRPFRLAPEAFFQQAVVALGVPLLAALWPVLSGARVTIWRAISQYGLASASARRDILDRGMEAVRFLPRPLLLSLRNAFRRRARLFLNLSTLTLAGAIFIAIFNLWTALNVVLNQVTGYVLSDIHVSFTRDYRIESLRDLVNPLPGVKSVEGWETISGQLYAPDKSSTTELSFVALPANSTLIHPVLTAGRWLRPDDENALVIGNHLLKERPDLKIGDQVVIRINDKDTIWRIVGFFRRAGNLPIPPVYVNDQYLERVLNRTGQVSTLQVTMAQHDAGSQEATAQVLQKKLKAADISISQITTGAEFMAQLKNQTEVLIYFLLIMALLIALVGGLGLMGTMTINVMERTREIGVMRAIGANNAAIQGMVIAEGLLVALLSWAMAVPLSVPLTLLLNYSVGASMFNMPFDFMFGWNGLTIWLAGVLLIAGLASALPAWRASDLTIRETLSYE